MKSLSLITRGRHVRIALVALVVCAYAAFAIQSLNARVTMQQSVTGHPFVISDLFPRWLGAKTMLDGRSPYTEDYRAELHTHYYGEPYSREWERDTFGTIAEFFYPPFVLIPLLPLLPLPFEVARWLSTLLLALCLGAGTLLWLRHARLTLPPLGRAAAFTLSLVFLPSVDLLLLQQLTGLVYLYVIAAVVLASRRCYAFSGLLLALAMIKPQSALIPAAALLFWALWLRERRTLVLSFGAAMLAQFALAQWLVPDWIPQFLAANARYRDFNTIGFWLPGQLLGFAGGVAASVLLVAYLTASWWRARHEQLDSQSAVRLTALTLTAGLILMPDIAYYNKVFLLPTLAAAARCAASAHRVERLTARLLLMAVALPVLLFAVVSFLRVLVPGAPAWLSIATVSAAHAAEAPTLLLPIFALPAALAAVFAAAPLRRRLPQFPTRRTLERLGAVAVAGAVSSIVLLSGITSWPQHPDEAQYIWSAGYYTGLARSANLRPTGSHIDTDPGWSPAAYWALTQPMGARALIGAGMHLTGAAVPAVPFMFENGSRGPETFASPETLRVARLGCTLAAVAGFMVLALRWRALGLVPLLLLVAPHARTDLTGAWAEGPLFLGLSLCAAAWRTRFFPYACALAATFKLTALAVWPVACVLHPLGRSRIARTLGLLRVAAVWSALTPPSWFFGGPIYLILMLSNRATEYSGQAALYGGEMGVFAPSRYFLPLELAVALATMALLPRLLATLRTALIQKVLFVPVVEYHPHRLMPQLKLAAIPLRNR
jgi:hypothetical protein